MVLLFLRAQPLLFPEAPMMVAVEWWHRLKYRLMVAVPGLRLQPQVSRQVPHGPMSGLESQMVPIMCESGDR